MRKVLLWTVTLLLAFIFFGAGTSKLTSNPSSVEQFVGWGYASWFRYLVGGIEVLGALTILVPRVASFGAYALVMIMLGAAYTHIRAGEWPNPLFNALFAAGLLWIGKSRRAARVEPPAA